MISWNFRAGPRRTGLLVAALLLAILQVAAVSHLIGHSATGDNAGCEICVSAGHAGSALVSTAPALPVFHATLGHTLVAVLAQVSARSPAVYRSRAPPVFT